MIRVIDRNRDTAEVVQKVVNYHGKLIGYQYGIPGQGMTQCSTLEEARIGIGKFTQYNLGLFYNKDKPSKPKLSLPSFS